VSDILNFAIGLEASAFIGGAEKGKSAVDKLSASLADGKAKLASYQAQLSRANDLGDVAGHAKYSQLVDQGKKSVFDLTQQLEQVPVSAGGASSALGALPPPLLAIAAGATVAIGGAVALGSALAGLVEHALEVTGVNERLAATFDALGDTRGGKNTLEFLNDLSTELPQSRAQLAEWTKQLQATGVTDLGELRAQIKATAGAQAILGDAGAHAYTKLQEKVHLAVEAHTPLKIATKGLTTLYHAGLNIEDVAQRMGVGTNELASSLKAGTVDAQKFGNALTESLLAKGKRPLEAMGNELGVLKQKGKETIDHLFDGIETGPLVGAIKGVIMLGDQSQPSGQAMKAGLGGALNSVIKLIGSAITEATVFFLDVEIFALDAYIAMKPLISAFEKVSSLSGKVASFVAPAFAGPGDTNSGLREAPGALERAGSFGNVGTAIGVGNALTGGIGGSLAALPVLVYDTISSIGGGAARDAAHASGVELGKATIEGIREGTDTHSPSPLVIGIGRSIGLSLGMGMEASPEPARASRTISGYALGGLAGGGHGGAANGNGGGTVIHVGNISITAPEGVTDAATLGAMGLTIALERMQLAAGR
jgi:hypothetical protein